MLKSSLLFFVFIILLILTMPVIAGANNFEKGLNYAHSISNNVKKSADSFQPEKVFKNYSSHPNETKYYSGVIGGDDKNLTNDAISKVPDTKESSTVVQSFNTRPSFKINPKSRAVEKGNLIESDAYNISRGIPDEYVDCKHHKICKTTYIQKTCNERTHPLERICTKTPHIRVTTYPAVITRKTARRDRRSAWVFVFTDGIIKSIRITAYMSGKGLEGTPTATFNDIPLTYKQGSGRVILFEGDNLNIPIAKDNKKYIFAIKGRNSWSPFLSDLKYAKYSITVESKLAETSWVSSCTGIDISGREGSILKNTCYAKKQECTQKGGIRNIDGVPAELDCWQYKTTFKCDTPSDNNCAALREQKCTQLSASCRTRWGEQGDICAVQDKTFNCPIEKCKVSDDISCGSKVYCMDGNCTKHQAVQNQNFDKAVSGMAAIGGSAADIKESDDISAFSGKSMKCRKIGFGYSNCCKDRGWGQDIGLKHCTAAEKELGLAKQKHMTKYVGERCDKRVLGKCLKSHKIYCVFSSKLASIVQVQGREKQLHIGFGSAKHPACRGLRPDELEQIDFGKIDFSDLYQDIRNNTAFPDISKTESKVAGRIRDFYERSQKHS